MTVAEIHELTKIDNWFLSKLRNINDLRLKTEELAAESASSNKVWSKLLGKGDLALLKKSGFSDRQISEYLSASKGAPNEIAVRAHRKSLGVLPFVKQIDTLAAEFPAQTNYLYMTYSGSEHDVTFASAAGTGGVIVLGCGAYCIGSSVEFDWCAVSCVRAVRDAGKQSIVINYNPETVSTDYDECDKLYFEELSLERVLDIYELEYAEGVVVSVGGQIPNNLAMPLVANGANVFGTSPASIDRCEDRNQFSAMLDTLQIDQPAWAEVSTLPEAREFAQRVEYPCIVRPSYVLSGAAMKVVPGPAELEAVLNAAGEVSGDHPVVISKFIVNAKEIEFDGVADAGRVLNYAISEHVENAGVHSGDATLVLPAQKLWVETQRRVKKIAYAVAAELHITGPFNMQFMAVDNNVLVIECNLRSSRTFPFISKTFNHNFIRQATQAMMGLRPKVCPINVNDMDFVAVKAPQFSFTRLAGADPTLGVEMSSTGEVSAAFVCFVVLSDLEVHVCHSLIHLLMSSFVFHPFSSRSPASDRTLRPHSSPRFSPPALRCPAKTAAARTCCSPSVHFSGSASRSRRRPASKSLAALCSARPGRKSSSSARGCVGCVVSFVCLFVCSRSRSPSSSSPPSPHTTTTTSSPV